MVPARAVGQAGGDPKADHRHAPHHDRGHDGQSLASDPRQPAGEHPADDRTHRHRGGQQRHRVPPSTGPPKLSCAICGKSARGMPRIIAIRSTTNDISTTVLSRQVAEPVHHRAKSPARRARIAVGGRDRRKPERRPDRRDAGDRVDQIQRGQVDPVQHHAGEQRPDDGAELKHRRVQRVGRGQLIARHHPRDRRRAGGRVDRVERLLHRQQTQHHPHVVHRQGGLQPQQNRRHRQPARGDDQQHPPVHRVRPGAAPQAEYHQRDEREDPGKADVCRVLGERVQLNRYREDGEVGPDDGDAAGQPQPAEVRASAAG